MTLTFSAIAAGPRSPTPLADAPAECENSVTSWEKGRDEATACPSSRREAVSGRIHHAPAMAQGAGNFSMDPRLEVALAELANTPPIVLVDDDARIAAAIAQAEAAGV